MPVRVATELPPLHRAVSDCGDGACAAIEAILAGECRSPLRESFDGNTPLHYACGNTAIPLRVVELLVRFVGQKGESIDVVNFDLQTPLHVACLNGNTAAAMHLLRNGADVLRTDCDGDTPLHLAAMRNHPNTVGVLCDRGAELSAQNNNVESPMVCGRMHDRVIEVLQSHTYRSALSTAHADAMTAICPITRAAFVEPVVAMDGYTYEKYAIMRWFDGQHRRSVMTNEALTDTRLVPNYTLKGMLSK